MIEMMEQETTTKTGSGYTTTRTKQIRYACGCSYLFDHQITLEHICQQHERELFTFHG
jgi:hypothetical protein